MSDTIQETDTSTPEQIMSAEQPYEDTDDPNHKVHIINAMLNQHVGTDLSAQEIVDTARLKGIELIMLCGRKFVPKANPEKYGACKACVRVATLLMGRAGE